MEHGHQLQKGGIYKNPDTDLRGDGREHCVGSQY